MELLYRGFDGLEVSFQCQINQAFCHALERAKEEAQKFRRDEFLEWGGVGMLVKESGARGGYSFMARSGCPEVNWFFKKPNRHDPWGVRVSCSSFQLASCGFGKTRAALISTLENWKIQIPVGGESIGRVDYAMDFLAPDLVLHPDQFVMHSNYCRADHYAEIEMRTQGKSGRVSSVTVGKMPGRQIIVYDKHAEITAARKLWWQTIWDAARKRKGMPPLDHSDPTKSRVWRVEVRAGKKHLKDTWAIRTWENLDARIGDVFARSLDVVRYTEPTNDTNRSRWPNHPLWGRAQKTIADDLFEMRNFAEPSTVKRVKFEAYDQMLVSQIVGLNIARAGLHRIQHQKLTDFVLDQTRELTHQLNVNANSVALRLSRATDKLKVLNPQQPPSYADEV